MSCKLSIKNISEIGPGDSLGIGLSALYTGADNYFAFDVVKHTDVEKNLKINDELAILFKNKTEIPNGVEHKSTYPKLIDYSFPQFLQVYSSDFFEEKRISIKDALLNKKSKNKITYTVPWYNTNNMEKESLDLIISQAVMEHVDDIEFAYKKMYEWLKKGGIMSHQVDFKAHEMSKNWDGHWYINEKYWKFLLRGRKYPMNRLPLSAHINVLKKVGFSVINLIPVKRSSNYTGKLPKVKNISFTQEDLTTSGALIQVIKK